MAGPGPYPFDPALVNQALAMSGGQYRVPMSTPDGAPPMSAPYDFAPPSVPAMGPSAPVASMPVPVQSMPEPDYATQSAPNYSDPSGAESFAPAPPLARMPAPPVWKPQRAAPAPVQQADAPAGVPPVRRGAVAAPRSPYGAMAADARGQAAGERAQADAAELGGDVATATMQDAVARQGEAQSVAADAMAGIHERAAGQEREFAAMSMQKDAARAQANAERLREIDRDNKAIDNYTPTDNRSGASKAMGLLAIALGGIGQAFSAAAGQQTRNTALDIVNMDIDRRLQEQRERLANKRTAVTAKTSALGVAQGLYQDEREQDALARALEISATTREIEAAKAKGLGAEATAKADELIGQLSLQRDQVLLGLHDQRSQQLTQKAEQATLAQYQERKAAAAAAASANSPERLLKLQGMAADIDKTKAETGKLRGEAAGETPFLGESVQISNPETFAAFTKSKPSPAEQQKLRASVQGHAMLTAAVQRIKELKAEFGSERFTTEAAAEMDMQQQQAVAGLNELKDGSVIQEGEYERYKSMIPGSSDYSYSAMPKLDGLQKSVDTRLDAQLKTIGASLKPRASQVTRKGAAK